ncbi:MAG: hypothetical protein ABJA78_15255 [Ferruginibacter sp.]
MKFLFSLIFCMFLFSCGHKTIKPLANIPVISSATTFQKNYSISKKEITNLKQANRFSWKKMPPETKQKIFSKAVVETIIPAWIGTDWSFNGITQIPGKGSIACGYFVTTVLQDAGLHLARIKLAQCPSEEMIRTLVQSEYIHRFSNIPMNDFIAAIQQQGYGLYITGLDCHTGFIYNDGKEIYFIHACYIGDKKVIMEKAATSLILQHSKYKITGEISADEKVLAGWID